MLELMIQHENALRLGAFLCLAAVMGVWERKAPRRPLRLAPGMRWPANLGLLVIDVLVLRLLFPVAAVAVAGLAAAEGWGLFHRIGVPAWAAFLVCVVALDLIIYLQHVAFHKAPWLWRVHRVQHTDPEFDFTTGVRFHPLEIALSMVIKVIAVVLLGAPVPAVITYELMLNVSAVFNHSNVQIPERVDGWLRLAVVTPDMHRVHHSIKGHELNSNFGSFLPWWDRLFHTYNAQPESGHRSMRIGLIGFGQERATGFWRLLSQPFKHAK